MTPELGFEKMAKTTIIHIISLFILTIIVFGCNHADSSNSERKELRSTSSAHSFQTARRTRQIAGRAPRHAKKISIIVSYSAIACGCPQWFETKEQKNFLQGVERFYLEPTNKTLINANNLWDGQTLPLTLKLVGSFSETKEAPRIYNTKAPPEKARIFWYDDITIVSSSKHK
jgi:hypothetical protein